MGCSLPGSSIHGIFQARVLEWVAIAFSRGSSWPRDRTPVSHIVDRRFTVWATREVHYGGIPYYNDDPLSEVKWRKEGSFWQSVCLKTIHPLSCETYHLGKDYNCSLQYFVLVSHPPGPPRATNNRITTATEVLSMSSAGMFLLQGNESKDSI